MSRIYLNVPYSEKEQAKVIGAKWDSQRRAWWVESTLNKDLFWRWLPSSEESLATGIAATAPTRALAIFENLDQAQSSWAIEDVEMMSYIQECNGIEVVFVPWECWRCHMQTIVFHAAALNPDVSSMLEVTAFMYWPDVLRQIDRARSGWALPRMGVIKPRFSRTLNREYVSQGCVHCDALVGEMHLHEDFNTICLEGRVFGNAEFKFRLNPTWPPEGLQEALERVRAELDADEEDDNGE